MPKPDRKRRATPTDDPARPRTVRPIVSSRHLSQVAPELSEFEFGLITASHAFERWMVCCMGASGHKNFGPLDVLVLHSVNHRDRSKSLNDICLVLNVADAHTVTYALRKLIKAGLVSRERQRKEFLYTTTTAGRALCEKYREVREDCLVSSIRSIGVPREEISRIADVLRALSGLYDQAARAAASL
jgi:predicted MarR family transcription regulator